MATVVVALTDILRIIQAELEEMPGMRLTEAQFRRLWDLEPDDVAEITTDLMTRGILTRDRAGRYCRYADVQR